MNMTQTRFGGCHRLTRLASTELGIVFYIVNSVSQQCVSLLSNRSPALNSQKTRIMQHSDHLRDDLELLRGHLQPDIERGHELATNVLSGIRNDIVVRFQNCLGER